MLALFFIAVYKNNLTHKWCNRAIDYIYDQPNWRYLSERELSNGYYDRIFINPLIWTYKKAFPNLVNDNA